jgi:hypothetical protein
MTGEISESPLKNAIRFGDTISEAAFFGRCIELKQSGPGSFPEGRRKEKRGGVITAKLKIPEQISRDLIYQVI